MNNYSEKQLQDARVFAAKPFRENAKHALDSDYGFPAETTFPEKLEWIRYQTNNALQIERGEADQNFTVRQRMCYFLTGKCIPFLA